MLKYFSLKNFIFVLTGIIFVLPLVFWQHSSYPFIFIKALWLQTGALLLFSAYLIALLFHWRKYRPALSWLALAVFLFYFSMAMSAFLGVDLARSWWSRSERMTGLFIMLHYGALFLVWRSILNREEWSKLWKFFVGIPGLLVVLAGLIQVFSPKFIFNLGSERVVSTLGNPIYLASFCLFVLFSAAIFWHKSAGRWRHLWLVEIGLAIFVLFASQTRGALVGFWCGLFLLGVLLLFLDNNLRAKFKKPILVLLISIIVLPLLIVLLRNASFIRVVPVLSRFFNTPLEQATGGSRLVFWQMAINGWKDRPWFGWGWENYYQMADKEYLPQVLRYSSSLAWTDNAHNILFNTLATVGAVGLLSYLAVYLFLYFSLFNKFNRRPESEKIMAIGLAAFFGAHLVQNLFAFENLSSYLFFFWLLAGVDICFNRSSDESQKDIVVAKKERSRLFAALVIFGKIIRVFAVFVIFVGVVVLINRFVAIPAKAERTASLAMNQAMVDFEGALNIHRQALKIQPNPYSSEFSFGFGQFLLVWLSSHPEFAENEKYRSLAIQMYDTGIKAVRYYLSFHPTDTMAGNLLASGYADGYEMFQQLSYLAGAEEMFQKTLAFSPRRQILMYGLTKVEIKFDKPAEALVWARKALNEDPTIADSHWNLSLALRDNGEDSLAFDSLKKAEELGYLFNQYELSQAFQIYESVGRAEEAEERVRQQIYGQKAVNRRLILVYSSYLRKIGRASEADELEKILQK